MADDPNQKHIDSWLVSKPHEYEYFKKKIKEAFPHKSDDAVHDAIPFVPQFNRAVGRKSETNGMRSQET